MNTIKLTDPSHAENFIRFAFEKSVLEHHVNITLQICTESEIISSDKCSVHISEIIKVANWYKNMLGYSGEYDDLIIEELNLKLSNYYFEKGDGIYSLTYISESGKSIRFQLWEQVGNSNVFIYRQFMDCIERCK